MTDHIAAFKASDSDLKHYGVKGMKWGQRKAESSGGKPRGKLRRAATKANVALNAGAEGINKGEKKLIFLPQQYRKEAASRTQTRVLGEALKINDSPEFKGKDIKRDPALKASYYNKVSNKVSKIYQEELAVARADALVDTLDTIVKADGRKMSVRIKEDELRHADGDVYIEIATVDLTLNNLGQIEDLKMSATSDDMLHSDLMHYGVKGMKWGQRKREASVSLDSEGNATVSGGSRKARKALAKDVEINPERHGLKPKDDSPGARYARLLEKAKVEGANSFSDEELRFVTQRGNAINQVNKLNEKKPGWIAQTAKNVLQQSAQKQMQSVSNDLQKKYIGS